MAVEDKVKYESLVAHRHVIPLVEYKWTLVEGCVWYSHDDENGMD